MFCQKIEEKKSYEKLSKRNYSIIFNLQGVTGVFLS